MKDREHNSLLQKKRKNREHSSLLRKKLSCKDREHSSLLQQEALFRIILRLLIPTWERQPFFLQARELCLEVALRLLCPLDTRFE